MYRNWSVFHFEEKQTWRGCGPIEKVVEKYVEFMDVPILKIVQVLLKCEDFLLRCLLN